MPITDDQLTWQEVREATTGHWLHAPPDSRRTASGIFDDSRCVTPGSLFVAIRGDRMDGHAFIAQTIARNPGAVCIDRNLPGDVMRALEQADVACLRVNDSLRAFHRLARAHRRQFRNLRVLAVTGSSGKTSCRAILQAILESAQSGTVLGTEGNTNNAFGVPRNLLRLRSCHRTAVLELGTNRPGEIAALAAMVEPDIAVITTIGRAHLEQLGGLQGVAREKGALLKALPRNGTAVLPSDTPQRAVLLKSAGRRRVISFGIDDAADVRVTYQGRVAHGQYGIHLGYGQCSNADGLSLTWLLGGRHQALNAAAAVAAALHLGVSEAAITKGLKTCILPDMRMRVVDQGNVHWVNDAYNANPDSVQAALLWFAELTEGTPSHLLRVVLGDMLELGEAAAEAHRDTVRYALTLFPRNTILCVGSLMRGAAEEFGVAHVDSAAAAKRRLAGNLHPGSWVLLKGSRGVGLENVM